MREPVVAGRFYPENQGELLSTIETYTQEVSSSPVPAIAAIAPHAGYIYSGQLAARTFKEVTIPQTIILIGPNHTGKGASISLSTKRWKTPLGIVPVNKSLAQAIVASHEPATVDESAHRFEHSLEVQLPFLQYLQPALSIVPITIKQLSYNACNDLASAIFSTLASNNNQILIVTSSDMNHYESRAISGKKDRMALDAIREMNPALLYKTVQQNNISMCGVIPVVITLLLSQKLGAKNARIVDYMDSGNVSGDIQQVVGYAGVIID